MFPLLSRTLIASTMAVGLAASAAATSAAAAMTPPPASTTSTMPVENVRYYRHHRYDPGAALFAGAAVGLLGLALSNAYADQCDPYYGCGDYGPGYGYYGGGGYYGGYHGWHGGYHGGYRRYRVGHVIWPRGHWHG